MKRVQSSKFKVQSLRNIYAHEYGWRVWVVRGNLNLRAFIPWPEPFGSHVALRRAVQIRDRFLGQVGLRVVESNTGHSGISETTKWVKYRPHDCFSVWLGRRHRPQMKRIYFGRERSREKALAMAVKLKQEVTHGA